MVASGRCWRGALALLLFGCGAGPGVLAQVGDSRVAVAEFQHYLESASGEPWQSVDDRVATRLLDQYLDQELVLEAGLGRAADHVAGDPAARTASVRPLLAELCGAAATPSDAAVQTELDRRQSEPRRRRVRLRQLLLPDLAAAEAARQRVADGEPFEEVSRQVSRAPNAASGGTLGLLEEGTLPPQIDAVVFGLEVGELSPPVRSPAGYHIFQVLAVAPAGTPSRTELEPAVRRELAIRAAGESTRACLERLAGEVGVRVYPDHLWFNYDGRYGGSEHAS